MQKPYRLGKFDEQIDVAGIGRVVARNRSKQFQRFDAEPFSEFRLHCQKSR
jgi:hypothetical protein